MVGSCNFNFIIYYYVLILVMNVLYNYIISHVQIMKYKDRYLELFL